MESRSARRGEEKSALPFSSFPDALSSSCPSCLRGENSGKIYHEGTEDTKKAERTEAAHPVIAKARSA